MTTAVAIFVSLLVTAVLVAALTVLRRRLRLVRRLSVPLYLAAPAAGLKVFLLLGAERAAGFDRALTWILVLLVSILVLRLVGLFVFDVHLHGKRGMRLPPLLPAVTMGAVYLVAALITLRLAYPGPAAGAGC